MIDDLRISNPEDVVGRLGPLRLTERLFVTSCFSFSGKIRNPLFPVFLHRKDSISWERRHFQKDADNAQS